MTVNFAKTLSTISCKLLAVMVLLLCLPQSASAEKTDWSEPGYSFRGVGTVILENISFETSTREVPTIAIKKLQGELVKGTNKLKCQVLTADQANVVGATADLIVRTKIKYWHNSFYIIPEHTEWETRTVYRNKDEKVSILVPVTYPPRRVDVSDIIADFEVYDARTGKMVFMREDNRSREDSNAQTNMFGRMANSFFSDLNKKLKK